MNERIAHESVIPTPAGGRDRGLVTRRGFLKLAPFVALAAASAACSNNYSEQSSTTKVGENKPRQDYGVTVETTPDRSSLELFTSKEYYFDKKQVEVTQAVNNFVNSGSHNVTEVQTSYTDGYLTAGRANYSPDTQGRGNNLRVKLIQSSQYHWDKKDGEVKRAMEDALKDTQNVYKVNTIFQNGYLLAAEVWYFQP